MGKCARYMNLYMAEVPFQSPRWEFTWKRKKDKFQRDYKQNMVYILYVLFDPFIERITDSFSRHCFSLQ